MLEKPLLWMISSWDKIITADDLVKEKECFFSMQISENSERC